MTNQDQIRHLKARIADLSERLPYADGQAYYDDKRKIKALKAELLELEKQELPSGDDCNQVEPVRSPRIEDTANINSNSE